MGPVPRLSLSAKLGGEIRAHLRAALPNEGCGLLLCDGAGRLRFHAARNALASPTRYSVHPEDLVAAYRAARELGGEIVAAVHSHPEGPAGPSARDRREWLTPELAMLIVSFAGGDERWTASYVSEGGQTVFPLALSLDMNDDVGEAAGADEPG